MRARILRIDEPDFGCEGRGEETVVLDRVIMKNLDTGEQVITKAEDAWLYVKEIDVGDCVQVSDETLEILHKL